MKREGIILSVALAGSALALPQAALACTIITLPEQPPIINYDPFSGLPQSVNFKIRLSTTCSDLELSGIRVVNIWFSDEMDGLRDKTIGGVPFDIKRNAESFLYAASDSQPPLRKDSLDYNLTVDLAGYRDYSYTISLPANMAAQTASKTLRLRYRYLNAGGAEVESSLDIPLNLQVSPSFDLRLADTDGTTGEIDLGTFDGTDVTRDLQLRVGATLPFKISMQSTQGSVLRRTTTCGVASALTTDPAESIGYTASLGTQSLSATQSFTRDQATLAETNQRINLPLRVTVPSFNPIERRAGQFCDVLTLRIEPKG